MIVLWSALLHGFLSTVTKQCKIIGFVHLRVQLNNRNAGSWQKDGSQLGTNARCKNTMLKSIGLETFLQAHVDSPSRLHINGHRQYTHTHMHNWLHREQSQLAPLVAVVTKETDFSRSTYSHPVCYLLVCSFIPPFSLPLFNNTLFLPLSAAFQPISIPTSHPIRCPTSMHMQMRNTWHQLRIIKQRTALCPAAGFMR